MKNDTCAHCGLPSEKQYSTETHLFCCLGCQSVYTLLNESGFSDFYNLEKNPGVSQKKTHSFDFLNDDAIVKDLLEYYDDNKCTITLSLPQIHCKACIWLLEQIDAFVDGILYARVSFHNQSLRIIYDPKHLTLFDLVTKLSQIGYPPRISLNSSEQQAQFNLNKERKRKNTSDLIRIGAAGFFFGNSMFVSLPDYLDTWKDMDFYVQNLFGFINLAFGIVAYFWCGYPFFEKSYYSLKQKKMSIDLPIVIGATALLLQSIYDIIINEQAGYIDSLTALLFFLLLGRWFQNKTFQTLNFEYSIKDIFPFAVIAKTALDKYSTWSSVKIEKLVKGDIIKLLKYGMLPADGILNQKICYMDYSNLTGESHPILVKKGETVFAGGIALSSESQFVVSKPSSKSYLVKLLTTTIDKKEKQQDSNYLDNLAKHFSISIITIASLSALVWYFLSGINMSIHIFVCVLIVACPCALSLSLPVTQGVTQRLLANAGFYLKNFTLLDNIKKISHLVFDKTGTLTNQKGYKVNFITASLSDSYNKEFASLTKNSNHPYSQIINKYIRDRHDINDNLNIKNFKEVPGKGINGQINGMENLLLGSREYMIAEGIEGLDTLEIKKDNKGHKEPVNNVYIAVNKRVIGVFEIRIMFKKGIFSCLSSLKKHGYELSLLSGDNASSKPYLQDYFHSLLFNQKPQEKLEYVNKLNNTMMIGDGLNDSHALNGASVGMVVSDDIQNFNPASHIILKGANIIFLDRYLSFIKSAHKTVRIAVYYALFYNIIGIGLAILGFFTPLISAILMPLSSISIVVFIILKTLCNYNRLISTD